ncbi:hypothetical protein ACPCYY_21175, partial [Bacillus pumilus]|uniref:hypothetical protein n=1 Tax=Bacillus pumilus TaxID=1408 RepID=UPI003C213973
RRGKERKLKEIGEGSGGGYDLWWEVLQGIVEVELGGKGVGVGDVSVDVVAYRLFFVKEGWVRFS